MEEIAEVFDGPNAIPDTKASERKLSQVEYREDVKEADSKA